MFAELVPWDPLGSVLLDAELPSAKNFYKIFSLIFSVPPGSVIKLPIRFFGVKTVTWALALPVFRVRAPHTLLASPRPALLQVCNSTAGCLFTAGSNLLRAAGLNVETEPGACSPCGVHAPGTPGTHAVLCG